MVDSSNSQQILKELNLVRTKPEEYAEKLLSYKQYFKDDILRIPGQTAIKTSEGFKAFEEAASVLKKTKVLPRFIFNTYLTKIAEDAFKIIEKNGDADAANSINLDELISKYGQIAGQFSQAIDFGSSTPELVVVNLLVDDGDQQRGNRANILNSKFSILGVANGTHKTFHHCSVITYARHFIPTGEDPGNLSDDCYEKIEKTTYKEEKTTYSTNYGGGSYSHSQQTQSTTSDQKQVPKYVYVREEVGNDFSIPKGCERLERQEKIILEDGVKRKLIKEVRHMKDGSILTDISKSDI